MRILALDTTTRGGSVAVVEDDRVLAVVTGDESRTHAERLPGEIARALDEAGVSRERIDLFAVATGPGAFTGLRIGLAAVQGLSMALNKPVIGVSALDALADQAKEKSTSDIISPWMDAQRGDVFATLIDRHSGITIAPPLATSPSALLDAWRAHLDQRHVAFIGDATARDAAVITARATGAWEIVSAEALAPHIARIGRGRRAEASAPHALEPLYVRRPDAEIERERRGR